MVDEDDECFEPLIEEEQLKQCLNCEGYFNSFSKFHRICDICKKRPHWHKACEDH